MTRVTCDNLKNIAFSTGNASTSGSDKDAANTDRENITYRNKYEENRQDLLLSVLPDAKNIFSQPLSSLWDDMQNDKSVYYIHCDKKEKKRFLSNLFLSKRREIILIALKQNDEVFKQLNALKEELKRRLSNYQRERGLTKTENTKQSKKPRRARANQVKRLENALKLFNHPDKLHELAAYSHLFTEIAAISQELDAEIGTKKSSELRKIIESAKTLEAKAFKLNGSNANCNPTFCSQQVTFALELKHKLIDYENMRQARRWKRTRDARTRQVSKLFTAVNNLLKETNQVKRQVLLNNLLITIDAVSKQLDKEIGTQSSQLRKIVNWAKQQAGLGNLREAADVNDFSEFIQSEEFKAKFDEKSNRVVGGQFEPVYFTHISFTADQVCEIGDAIGGRDKLLHNGFTRKLWDTHSKNKDAIANYKKDFLVPLFNEIFKPTLLTKGAHWWGVISRLADEHAFTKEETHKFCFDLLKTNIGELDLETIMGFADYFNIKNKELRDIQPFDENFKTKIADLINTGELFPEEYFAYVDFVKEKAKNLKCVFKNDLKTKDGKKITSVQLVKSGFLTLALKNIPQDDKVTDCSDYVDRCKKFIEKLYRSSELSVTDAINLLNELANFNIFRGKTRSRTGSQTSEESGAGAAHEANPNEQPAITKDGYPHAVSKVTPFATTKRKHRKPSVIESPADSNKLGFLEARAVNYVSELFKDSISFDALQNNLYEFADHFHELDLFNELLKNNDSVKNTVGSAVTRFFDHLNEDNNLVQLTDLLNPSHSINQLRNAIGLDKFAFHHIEGFLTSKIESLYNTDLAQLESESSEDYKSRLYDFSNACYQVFEICQKFPEDAKPKIIPAISHSLLVEKYAEAIFKGNLQTDIQALFHTTTGAKAIVDLIPGFKAKLIEQATEHHTQTFNTLITNIQQKNKSMQKNEVKDPKVAITGARNKHEQGLRSALANWEQTKEVKNCLAEGFETIAQSIISALTPLLNETPYLIFKALKDFSGSQNLTNDPPATDLLADLSLTQQLRKAAYTRFKEALSSIHQPDYEAEKLNLENRRKRLPGYAENFSKEELQKIENGLDKNLRDLESKKSNISMCKEFCDQDEAHIYCNILTEVFAGDESFKKFAKEQLIKHVETLTKLDNETIGKLHGSQIIELIRRQEKMVAKLETSKLLEILDEPTRTSQIIRLSSFKKSAKVWKKLLEATINAQATFKKSSSDTKALAKFIEGEDIDFDNGNVWYLPNPIKCKILDYFSTIHGINDSSNEAAITSKLNDLKKFKPQLAFLVETTMNVLDKAPSKYAQDNSRSTESLEILKQAIPGMHLANGYHSPQPTLGGGNTTDSADSGRGSSPEVMTPTSSDSDSLSSGGSGSAALFNTPPSNAGSQLKQLNAFIKRITTDLKELHLISPSSQLSIFIDETTSRLAEIAVFTPQFSFEVPFALVAANKQNTSSAEDEDEDEDEIINTDSSLEVAVNQVINSHNLENAPDMNYGETLKEITLLLVNLRVLETKCDNIISAENCSMDDVNSLLAWTEICLAGHHALLPTKSATHAIAIEEYIKECQKLTVGITSDSIANVLEIITPTWMIHSNPASRGESCERNDPAGKWLNQLTKKYTKQEAQLQKVAAARTRSDSTVSFASQTPSTASTPSSGSRVRRGTLSLLFGGFGWKSSDNASDNAVQHPPTPPLTVGCSPTLPTRK